MSMTTTRGTVDSRNFGSVSYKSNVYNFGILLLEMVGGRKNVDVTVKNTSQIYFTIFFRIRLYCLILETF